MTGQAAANTAVSGTAVGAALHRLGGSWWSLPLVAVVALLSTLLFWVFFPPDFLTRPIYTPEAYAAYGGVYSMQVEDLLEGEGLVNFRQPPLMPLGLAAIYYGSSLLQVPVAYALASFVLAGTVLAALLLFALTRKLWGPGAAVVVILAWSLYLPAQHLTTFPAPEIPLMVLLFGALLLLVPLVGGRIPLFLRPAAAVFCGLLLGLTALIQMDGAALGLLAAAAVIAWAREYRLWTRLILGTLIVLASGAAMFPWEVYVYRQTGQVIPISTGAVPAVLAGLTEGVGQSQSAILPPSDDVRALQSDVYDRQYRQLNSLRDIAAYLWHQMETRPLAVIRLLMIKAARSWYGTAYTVYDGYLLLLQVPVLGVLLVALRRAWRGDVGSGRHTALIRRTAGVVIVLALYFWAVRIAWLSVLRPMIPAMGLLFLLLPAVFPARWQHAPRRTDAVPVE